MERDHILNRLFYPVIALWVLSRDAFTVCARYLTNAGKHVLIKPLMQLLEGSQDTPPKPEVLIKPEILSPGDRSVRFYIQIDDQTCKGCELCIPECPKDVIEMTNTQNLKGWRVAEPVRNEDCIGCKKCALVCPDVAITVYKET